MTSQIIHGHPALPPLSPIDTNKRRRRDLSQHDRQQSHRDQNADEAVIVADGFHHQQLDLLPSEYNGEGTSNTSWGRNDLVAASSSSFHRHHYHDPVHHRDADHFCEHQDNADISPNAPSAGIGGIGGKGEKYTATNTSYDYYSGYENDAPEESIEPSANRDNNDNDKDNNDHAYDITKGTVHQQVFSGSSSPTELDFAHEQQEYDHSRADIRYYHNGSNINDATERYHPHHQGRRGRHDGGDASYFQQQQIQQQELVPPTYYSQPANSVGDPVYVDNPARTPPPPLMMYNVGPTSFSSTAQRGRRPAAAAGVTAATGELKKRSRPRSAAIAANSASSSRSSRSSRSRLTPPLLSSSGSSSSPRSAVSRINFSSVMSAPRQPLGIHPSRFHRQQTQDQNQQESYDDSNDEQDEFQSLSTRTYVPEELYHHQDVKFWSYAVGIGAHPRSCHGSFGHRHNNRDDSSMWTRDSFDWDSDPYNILGRGQFGRVCKVRVREGGRQTTYAIKCLTKSAILQNNKNVQIVRREVEIHTRLNHPKIVRMEGYFHTGSSMFLVLEYANGGDLFTVLKDQLRALKSNEEEYDDESDGVDDYVAVLPHMVATHIIHQLAEALRYLASKDIAHRDLKPENCLLQYLTEEDAKKKNYMKAEIKLIDFGWSCICPSPDSNRRTTLCGTPEYIPPEMLQFTPQPVKRPRLTELVGRGSTEQQAASEYDARYCDGWSLGCMVYELVVGKTPLHHCIHSRVHANSDEATFAAIRRFDDDDLEALYAGPDVPNEWKQFGRIVRGLMRTNPMERLSMEQVLRHPWLGGST